MQKVEEQPIELAPVKNVKLSSVLRMVLSRIVPEDGSSGFHIRPDGVIEVAVNAQDDTVEGPPEKALAAALNRPVTFSVDEDRGPHSQRAGPSAGIFPSREVEAYVTRVVLAPRSAFIGPAPPPQRPRGQNNLCVLA